MAAAKDASVKETWQGALRGVLKRYEQMWCDCSRSLQCSGPVPMPCKGCSPHGVGNGCSRFALQPARRQPPVPSPISRRLDTLDGGLRSAGERPLLCSH